MDLNQTAASLEYNLNVFPTCHETLKQFSQDKLLCSCFQYSTYFYSLYDILDYQALCECLQEAAVQTL